MVRSLRTFISIYCCTDVKGLQGDCMFDKTPETCFTSPANLTLEAYPSHGHSSQSSGMQPSCLAYESNDLALANQKLPNKPCGNFVCLPTDSDNHVVITTRPPEALMSDSVKIIPVSQSLPKSSHPAQMIQNVPHTRQSNGLFFSNFEEAMSIFPSPSWRCPANDITIPNADQQRQAWALKLLNAVNNTENVHDKQGVVFRKRWYSPSTGPSNFYSPTDKEILCWDILDLAERLHRHGPGVFQSFDSIFWKHAAKTRDWTFRERADKIIELLASSKARCEKLLAGLSLRMIVANPTVLISSTKGNAKQNGRRQTFLEAGRAMMKLDQGNNTANDVEECSIAGTYHSTPGSGDEGTS